MSTLPMTRRARFLHQRHLDGKTRPTPVRVIGGNCMSVSATRATSSGILRAYLDHATHRRVDALFLSECSDFSAQAVCDDHAPGLWDAVQFGDVDSPESGACIIVRNGVKVSLPVLRTLSEATSEGGGIRRRSAVRAHLSFNHGTPGQWGRFHNALHLAPPRAPRARAQGLAVAQDLTGIRAGDTNLVERVLTRAFGGCRVHVTGVIAVIVPRWIPSRTVRVIPRAELAGADHDGIVVEVWPAA